MTSQVSLSTVGFRLKLCAEGLNKELAKAPSMLIRSQTNCISQSAVVKTNQFIRQFEQVIKEETIAVDTKTELDNSEVETAIRHQQHKIPTKTRRMKRKDPRRYWKEHKRLEQNHDEADTGISQDCKSITKLHDIPGKERMNKKPWVTQSRNKYENIITIKNKMADVKRTIKGDIEWKIYY